MARAFSLIEVLVVLGVFVIVAGFSLFMGIDAIARGSAMGERDTLVSMLVSARTAGLANIHERPHGVRIDATHFTRFEGTAFDSFPATHKAVARNGAVAVSGPTLPVDIIFSQLAATTTGYSTITVSEAPASYTIDINSMGQIEW